MITVNLESVDALLGIFLIVVATLNVGFYLEMFRRVHRIDSRKAWIGLLFWPAMLVYGAKYWSELRTPYVGHLASIFVGIATLVGLYAFSRA